MGFSGDSLGIEEVLEGVGDTVEGASKFAPIHFLFGAAGLGHGPFGQKGYVCMQVMVEMVDGVEVGFGQFRGGELSASEQTTGFRDGEEA